MLLVRNFASYKTNEAGIVLTIGNFDGVHIGHREIIQKLKAEAKKLNIPSAVMCFEPQPLEFFALHKIPARLSRFKDKYRELQRLGVDILFCPHFNKEFAELSPTNFVTSILHKKLNVKYLVVGDDFHFGKSGKGDYNLLESLSSKCGFTVWSMSSFLKDSHRVSSTLIRSLLQNDMVEKVLPLLGEYFYIWGKVCHGQRLGRTISFPTANINLNRRVIPLFGVYAVIVTLPNNEQKYGIANLGLRPTVNGKEPRLEVYIFDFNEDLYTKEIKVSFVKKIRDEQKFASLTELKKQILLDETVARKLFKL
ncbi:MAG: bifunctional riboflavin kinase/FAD synthetase [Succinivibrionaceae bacterium]